MTSQARKARWAVTLAVVCGGMSLLAGQAPAPPAAPSAVATAQVDRGRTLYSTRCAGCDLPDMQGRNEAATLAGPNFVAAWRERRAGELAQYIQSTMPPSRPGSLSEGEATDITAFILAVNGASAGTTPLAYTAADPVGRLASGQVRAAVLTAPTAPVSTAASLTLNRSEMNAEPSPSSSARRTSSRRSRGCSVWPASV